MRFFPGGKYSYIAVAAADILSFIVGTASAWSSPIIPKLTSTDTSENPLGRRITDDESSWIGSLLSMGGIGSPIVWAFLVQIMGRRPAGIIVTVPFLVAYLMSAFAETIELYYAARVLMGIGIGGMFCVLPIYVVEVAEDVNRGLLAASTGCFLVAGMLFSYVIGPFVSIMAFNLILCAVCVLYVPLFWFLSPETPYYLVKVGKDQQALKSLYYLRRSALPDLENELTRIKAYLSSMTEGSFLSILQTKASIKAFIYSIALATFQQLSGIQVIFAYMQSIFALTGGNLQPEVSSIVVASVQLVSSFASPLLSDKAGRKTLLLVSITGATLAEVVLGVYFYLQDNEDDISDIGWLPVVSMVVFMMFYNFGMGSLPWAIMPEILPSNVISKAMLIVTCVYWFVGWLSTQYFASLMNAITGAGCFWLFAGLCVLHWLFVFFFIFETKGKSLREIQEILSR